MVGRLIPGSHREFDLAALSGAGALHGLFSAAELYLNTSMVRFMPS